MALFSGSAVFSLLFNNTTCFCYGGCGVFDGVFAEFFNIRTMIPGAVSM